MVRTVSAAIVHIMEPASDALGVEEVVAHFGAAFQQSCGLSVVERLVLERFRVISQAGCWGYELLAL